MTKIRDENTSAKLTRLALILMILLATDAVCNQDITISDENGKKLVNASHIIDEINNDEDVYYNSFTIVGDIDLSQKLLRSGDTPIQTSAHAPNYIKSTINITDSSILGSVDFEGITFSEPLDFRNTTFYEDADFYDAEFQDEADFEGGRFMKRPNFGRTKFEEISFNGAQFADGVSFMRAKFSESATFNDVLFSGGKANFEKAVFFKDADFRSAKFNEDAYFTYVNFGGFSYISDAKFYEEADFSNSKFMGEATFSDTAFMKDATFKKCWFNDSAKFLDSVFGRDAYFSDARFREDAYFQNDDFEGDLYFWNTEFDGKLYLNKTKFDRMIVQWDDIKDQLVPIDAIYFSLMEDFSEMGRTEDANSCYYEYRDIARKRSSGGAKISETLKWMVSGYGVRPFRLVGGIILLIILFGVAFYIPDKLKGHSATSTKIDTSEVSGSDSQIKGFNSSIYFSAMVFTAVKIPEYFKDLRGRRYLVLIERGFSWFFLALLVATMTRTFLG